MGNPITHNREDAKKNIIISIRKVMYFQRNIKEILRGHWPWRCSSREFYGTRRRKVFYVAPTSVKIVSQGDTISEFEDRAVRFPYGNIDRVAGVEHWASGGYVYRASHKEKVGLNLSLKIPGDSGTATFGRFSANRQVNFPELSFSSVSDNSEVKSVMRIGMRASKSVS